MVATRIGSLPDCRPLLAGPDDLTLAFQPVVDLVGGTLAGYQVQARFPGTAGPDVWFAAGADAGLAAELEALLVHKALSRLPHLPSGFLVVPVRAHLLATAPVQEAFASRPRLDRLVVEIRSDVPDALPSAQDVARLRARGAGVAVASEDHLRPAADRPDVVVLDRETVRAAAGIGVAVPGAPRVLADDIETPQDLTAALECGGALGRGWLFGPPSSHPGPLESTVTGLLRDHRARVRLVEPVLALVRPVHRTPVSAGTAPAVTPAVEVDEDGAPVALLVTDPAGTPWRRPITLCVLPDAACGETLRRASSRSAEHRRDPVLCTDEDGRPLGILHVADLVRATAR